MGAEQFMSNIFFTSDTHFGHDNIIKYCERPFADHKEMDAVLLENWNKVVGKNDVVYHHGDVGCWFGNCEWITEILPHLNGKKKLIAGNHDGKLLKVYEQYFEILNSIHSLRYKTDEGKFYFNLCHYPILNWNGKFHGSIHTYGHTHSERELDILGPNAVHVGVDTHNFTPVHIDEVLAIVTKRNLNL